MSGGVLFPTDEKGARSTTSAAKAIWAEALLGAIEPNDGETPQQVVDELQKEKDWRYQYTKHLSALGRLACASKGNALGMARKGIDKVYEDFEFERDGKTMKFKDAMAQLTTGSFGTGSVQGKAAPYVVASMPYKDTKLEGSALKEHMRAWADKGCVEASAADAVSKVIDNGKDWLDLSGRFFVLLGAGSELGPLPALLRHGATVVAVRTRKPEGWKKTLALAAESAGTLIYPITDKEGEGGGAPAEKAGCDLLTQTPEIRNWLLSVLPMGAKVTVGCYTYLDSDAHVRVSLACDAIMVELAEKRKAALAYIASPAVDCLLPAGCLEAMEANREKAPWWQRMTGAPAPKVSSLKMSNVYHGFVVAQGPNYALAKTLQNWRCFLAREAGNVVSANIGPPSRTESVMHNRTMKVILDGMAYIEPNEAFDAPTASDLMAMLLIHDLRNEQSIAQPQTAMGHPWELMSVSAVHGGCWRAGYDLEGSYALSGAVYACGSLAPKR